MLVLNRVPARSRLNAEIEADLRGLGVPIARTKVGNRVAMAAAASAGLGVTESEPSSRAAGEIRGLSRQVLRRLPT